MKENPETLDSLGVLLRVVRRFGARLAPQRLVLAGALLAVAGEIVLRFLEPWALKLVVDVLVAPGKGRVAWAEPWVARWGRDWALWAVCGFTVAVTGLRAVAAYAGTIGLAKAGSRALSGVRADVFRHLQCLPLAFHHRSRHGDLVMRVIQDVSQLQDALVTALIPMATKTVLLVGMVAFMFLVNARLALTAVVLLPLFWWRGRSLGRRIHETARRQRRREGALAATAAESLGAMQAVQALALEGRFAASFEERNRTALREDVRGKRLSARLERSVDVFIAAATALVLWQGTRLVWEGALTAGDLLVFLAYLKTAFRPLQDSAKYSGRLAKAAAAAERVLRVLEESPGVRDLPGARVAPAFRGELEFRGVTFRHPAEEGKPAAGVEDISFTVEPGRMVALVGPSGSGKSTLLALVSRLYDPLRGSVRIDGQDVRDYTLASLRTQVSVVLQDAGLFAGTVADNIRAGREEASDAEVEAAARLARAHEFIEELPDGYATVLGERGITLSQGQRQRLSIARAALRKAPILLLDEPTSALDAANAEAVFDALRCLGTRCGTLLVTHDPEEASHADLVLVLERGRIVRRVPGRRSRISNREENARAAGHPATGPGTPSLTGA